MSKLGAPSDAYREGQFMYEWQCHFAIFSMSSGDGSGTEVDEPWHLLCPVTHVMMGDPVILCATGNTYDWQSLLKAWQHSHPAGSLCDPLTNQAISDTTCITNWSKRRYALTYLLVKRYLY